MACLAENVSLAEDLIDFPQLFRRCLESCADSLAVECAGDRISYGQLDRAANRFANFLLAAGFAPHKQVGLCMNRSIDAIVAMLGVLKASSAFVPLDPEFPVDRLKFMVEDADIQVIICDPEYQELFTHSEAKQPVIIDPSDAKIEQASDEDPMIEIDPRELAYIMYTSGSTGMPKGVQIEHRSLATYCFADIDVYQLQAEDRTLQFSTLNFDIAIEEIFPPLLVGSTVVVRPPQRMNDEIELSAIIDRYRITAIHIAAAYWHEWVDLMVAMNRRVPRSLRLVIVTGEKVSPVHYRRWVSLCEHELLWCNAYGPTEVTVTSTVFIPDRDWSGESMPIGKPLKRYEAWILDSQDQPLGVGITGELYLGGEAVARGYLKRPERNAIAFREIDLPKLGRRRLYKTGDLARWLPSGDIEFAGRIDHQIKLGSYRIEPGEIEHHAAQHDLVRDALVTYDDVDGQKALIAYIARGDETITAEQMADYLRDKLPPYMVPSRYVFLHSFPKTINGKIDRRALPTPSSSEVARKTPVDAPRTELECELAAILAQVLQIPSLGIHDDFFALGGSSILVARAITRVREKLELQIPVRDFFANPTVASIALLLSERTGHANSLNLRSSLSRELRERLPTPEPFFFPSDANQLFAVYYRPVHVDRRQAVLICAPQGHEYARAHRNLQQLAIQLAQQGFSVLRFDHSGVGNSSGEVLLGTPQIWLNEIETAAKLLLEKSACEKLTMVGMRLGATLATTTDILACDRQVLIDPIFDGRDYVSMLERFQHYALTSRNRFPRVRTTSIDQLFGELSSPAKRQELSNLRLQIGASRQYTVMTSRDYEPQLSEAPNGRALTLIKTQDEIFWHAPEYTECAFACPEIFKSTLSVLSQP